METTDTFQSELTKLINKYNLENYTNTPDFILAQMIVSQLEAYRLAVLSKSNWFGLSDPFQKNMSEAQILYDYNAEKPLLGVDND